MFPISEIVFIYVYMYIGYGYLCLLSLQEVLIPYDPKSKHLRVDKNISLRVYCKDKAPGTWHCLCDCTCQ